MIPIDLQRATNALLRGGQKLAIAAVREELEGRAPNVPGPWLEKCRKGLGTRLQSRAELLERTPESLERVSEALWLRSLDVARKREKESLIGS